MHYKFLLQLLGAIFAIWLIRCLFAGSITVYAFLGWNIFLATIPLLIQPVFPWLKTHTKGVIQKIASLFFAGTWLLFLPNAFYLLTDFMHLNPQALVNKRNDENHYAIEYLRGDGLYMIDSLLLLCITLFGALAGGLALYRAYRSIRTYVSKKISMIAIGIVMVLVAIGVYIGRYGRWNSWDGILQPWAIVADLVTSLFDPVNLQRFTIVVTTIVILEVLSIGYVHHQSLGKHKPEDA